MLTHRLCPRVAVVVGDLGPNIRQARAGDPKCERGEQRSHDHVGQMHLPRERIEQGVARFRRGSGLHASVEVVEARQHQRAEHERRQQAGELVADAHEGDAPCSAFDRTDDADVGVGRGLQQRQSSADDEQSGQRARIMRMVVNCPNTTAPTAITSSPKRHALLHAGAAQHRGRRQREEKVRQIKRHRHQERVHVVELEGQLDEGDQRAVEPGHEAEDEEQRADGDHRRGRVALRSLSVSVVNRIQAHAYACHARVICAGMQGVGAQPEPTLVRATARSPRTLAEGA